MKNFSNYYKFSILFLDNTPIMGGAQMFLLQHLEMLNKDIFRPVIGCSVQAKENGLVQEYKKLGIEYNFVFNNSLKSFLGIFRLIRGIKQIKQISSKVDLIVGSTVRASIVGSFASLLSRKK